MSKLKVLVLVYKGMEPPESAPKKVIQWADWKTEYYVVKTLGALKHNVFVVGVDSDLDVLKSAIDQFQPDIVFNLLEEFNEQAVFDKNIVSYLELLGLPYTGANPQAMGIGRNKSLTHKLLRYHGLTTPDFFVVPRGQKAKRLPKMTFPLIVKSLTEEASLGISQKSVVTSLGQMGERIQFIHEHVGTPALVEDYIPGRELYLGVLGNKSPQAFKAWELSFGDLAESGSAIATRKVKFDKAYCEKHNISRGAAQKLPKGAQKRIQDQALVAYQALNLSGYARMDLRLTPEGEPVFIEVNPNPELAKGEDFANAARLSGLSYPQLIQKILDLGMAWRPIGTVAA